MFTTDSKVTGGNGLVFSSARHRSLFVYHLQMGGPDAVAVEWSALHAPRFESRVRHLGVTHVYSAAEADVVVVSGLLTRGNLDSVLAQLATMPSPSVLIAAGDRTINPSELSKLKLPGLAPYPLSHYADIHISVPGNPPTPQALIAAIAAAANILSQPSQPLVPISES